MNDTWNVWDLVLISTCLSILISIAARIISNEYREYRARQLEELVAIQDQQLKNLKAEIEWIKLIQAID